MLTVYPSAAVFARCTGTDPAAVYPYVTVGVPHDIFPKGEHAQAAYAVSTLDCSVLAFGPYHVVITRPNPSSVLTV